MDITGLLDNYDLTYTYGFWFIIESNKISKYPVFLGNAVTTGVFVILVIN